MVTDNFCRVSSGFSVVTAIGLYLAKGNNAEYLGRDFGVSARETSTVLLNCCFKVL